MSNRNVYIVVTRTNTIPSRVIRIYTGSPYNHVSLTLDGRLEDMVSFGRLHPFTPVPGGFVHEGKNKGFFRRFRDVPCRVYSKKISERECRNLLHLLQKIENRRCKFNHLGLITLIAGIPLKRENAYFCSQFCGKVLNESGHPPFSKTIWAATAGRLLRSGRLYAVI